MALAGVRGTFTGSLGSSGKTTPPVGSNRHSANLMLALAEKYSFPPNHGIFHFQ